MAIDLVSVADVRRSLARFGDRYLYRLFTDGEAAYARAQTPVTAERLAARFAAKEAVRKLLGAHADGVAFRSIEVVREPWGAPVIVLHGAAERAASRAGLAAISLSMSHEDDWAAAVVIAETRPRRASRLRTSRRRASSP